MSVVIDPRNFLLYTMLARRVSVIVMGKVAKGIKCVVSGCSENAVRSIPSEDVFRAGLKVTTTGRGYLCKNHYKELKKKLRKDKKVERWRMMP